MSTAVETPIVAPVAAPAPIELPAPVESAPAAVESAVVETPIAKSTEEVPAVTTAAVEKDAAPPALKRSPFSDLKNRLFAPKSPPTPATHVDEPVKPIEETAAPVVETPKENAVVVEPEVDPAPVTDATTEEEKAKKVKGPSVVDRVKALFEKKEKAPSVAKSELTEDAVAPAAEATTLPPILSAPAVVDETPAVETAPVAAAVEEPVKETEATSAAPAVESASIDDAAVKFDEATKTEEKPKKEKDLVKLGRRLSARFGAALSPKKEKKDPLAAAPVVAGAPAVASEAPVLAPIAVEEVKVEEAKAGLTTAAVEEPTVHAPAAVEETKVEDVVATPAVESEAPSAVETSTEVKA